MEIIQQINELIETNQSLKEENCIHADILDEKDEEIKKLTEQNKELDIKLAQKTNEVDTYQSRLSHEQNGLKGKLANREKQIEELKEQIDQTKINALVAKDNQIAKLERENIELREQIHEIIATDRKTAQYISNALNKFQHNESDNSIMKAYLEQSTEESETLTEFKKIYIDFHEWCVQVLGRQLNNIPDMPSFKIYLKKWQEKTKFGLEYGKKKVEAGRNGYEANLKFNLKVGE